MGGGLGWGEGWWIGGEVAEGLFHVGAGVGAEVFGPGGGLGRCRRVVQEGEGVAEGLFVEVAEFGGFPAAPAFAGPLVEAEGAVGVEDAEAEEDGGEVGEGFVVFFVGGEALFAEEAYVGEFVGEGGDDGERVVEVGFFEADDFLGVDAVVAGGSRWWWCP